MLTYFKKNMCLEKLWHSFQKRYPLSCGEAHSQALQQIERDQKCHLKQEDDKAEATKSKEKPKKLEVPQPSSPVPAK